MSVRDVRTGDTRRLTDIPKSSMQYSSVSPDGSIVAFACMNENWGAELWTVGTDGSSPRLLFSDESVTWLAPYDWSPDGQHILAVFTGMDERGAQIVLVSARDGAVHEIRTFEHGGPNIVRFSPDGTHIAYDWRPDRETPRDVFAIRVDGGREIPLIEHTADDGLLGWAPDGKHVLFSSDRAGTVGAWLLPITSGEPDGNPTLVKPEMWRTSPIGFARDGSFFYLATTSAWDVYVAKLDPESGALIESPTTATQRFVGGNGDPNWSPDGRYLAWRSQAAQTTAGAPRNTRIVIRSVETGETRELTPDLGEVGRYRWSPDSRSFLVKARGEADNWGLYEVDAQTDAAEMLINVDTYSGRWADWSADGKSIYYSAEYYEGPSGGSPQIVMHDLEAGREEVIYEALAPALMTPGNVVLSPDRQSVAVVLWQVDTDQGGTLLLIPVSGGERAELHRFEAGAAKPRVMSWTPDGRYLAYTVWDERELWRIPVEGGDPELLQWEGMEQQIGIRFHPDGERIAFTAGGYAFEVWVMEDFLPGSDRGGSGAESDGRTR